MVYLDYIFKIINHNVIIRSSENQKLIDNFYDDSTIL